METVPEVKGLQFESRLLCKCNQESAKASVHVERDVLLNCQSCNLHDRVNDPVRILRCGCQKLRKR